MSKIAGTSYGLTFWLSSPLFAICLPALYIGSLFLFNVVEPVTPFVSEESVYYCFGGLTLMAISAFWGMKREMRQAALNYALPKDLGDYHIDYRIFRLIALLAVIGFGLNVADLVIGSSFSLSVLDFVTVRETMGEREATLLAYPGNLLFPFCTVLLGASILYYEWISGLWRIFGIVFSSLAIALISLMLAGRSELVNLLILIYWWSLQRPALGLPIFPASKLLRLFILILFGFLLSMLFILAILRSASDNQLLSLLTAHANTLSLSSWAQDLIANQNPFIANGLAEFFLYWSHSVVYFDKLYNNWDLQPTIFTAFSSFMDRRVSSLGFTPDFEARWGNWINIMGAYGYYPNAFGTTWSQIVISLGKFFGLITAVIIAFVSGRIFVQAKIGGDFRKRIISSILFLFFFLWFQSSVFINPIFEWGMIIALFGPKFVFRLACQRKLAD